MPPIVLKLYKEDIVVVVLLFYVHGKHRRSCRDGQLTTPHFFLGRRGWSGGAMVLGKLPVPGRPTSLDKSRARAYCSCSSAGGGCLDIFTLIYPFSSLSPFLWETARYRLKYCLKGPLNPKQPTNQILGRLRPPKRLTSVSCTYMYFCQ